MKRTRRFPTRLVRWTSLCVCFALIASSLVWVPLQSTNAKVGSSLNPVLSNHAPPSGFLSKLGGFLAALLIPQGGSPPSVPGANLPDLDAMRAVQPANPSAPPAIPSTEICQECPPCPGCGPINHPPVANAGGPYFGAATQAISFNGLNSFDIDPDDGISDYAWSFGDNTAVVHGATPAHTYQSAGTYTVSLTVTDQHNATNADSTTASITAAPTPTPTPGPSPTPETNNAVFVSQTVPTTMTAGLRYPVAVRMRNTGSTTWSAAHLYRLGAQNPIDNGTWGRARVFLPGDVAPGAEVTFNFTVVGPPGGESMLSTTIFNGGWCRTAWNGSGTTAIASMWRRTIVPVRRSHSTLRTISSPRGWSREIAPEQRATICFREISIGG
jgi:hypothetical protein